MTTLVDVFRTLEKRRGEFLVYDDGYRVRRHSYADVTRAARGFASRLAAAGVWTFVLPFILGLPPAAGNFKTLLIDRSQKQFQLTREGQRVYDAAKEMLHRVHELTGHEPARFWGGTFHSIGARLLRLNAESLGFRRDFTILDRADAEDLMHLCRSDLGLGRGSTRFPQKSTCLDIYSRCVNAQTPLAEVLKTSFPWCKHAEEGLSQLFAAYTEDLKHFSAEALPGSFFDGLGPVAFDLANPYVVVGLLFGGLLPLLFGGMSSFVLKDTWEYDGTSWTQKCTTSPCSTSIPPARRYFPAAFDSVRNRVVIFGGAIDNINNLNDTPYRTETNNDGMTYTHNGAYFMVPEGYQTYGRETLVGFNYKF